MLETEWPLLLPIHDHRLDHRVRRENGRIGHGQMLQKVNSISTVVQFWYPLNFRHVCRYYYKKYSNVEVLTSCLGHLPLECAILGVTDTVVVHLVKLVVAFESAKQRI